MTVASSRRPSDLGSPTGYRPRSVVAIWWRRWTAADRRSVQFLVPVIWLAMVVVTGALYVLPLSQPDTDVVSNASFVIGALLVVFTVSRAIRRSSGLDRVGWSALAASTSGALVVFVLDPASSGGAPTLALLVAPFAGVAALAVVVIFGRHGLSRLDLARIVLDGAWLTAGFTAGSWHWTMSPLSEAVDTGGELFIAATFPIVCAMAGSATILLLPRTGGRARMPFFLLGSGAALLAVAGAFHVRLAYEGTLVFGTWYDYFWTIGLAFSSLAALEPSIGSNLRSVRPSARSHHLITIIPVASLSVPFFVGGAWDDTPAFFGIGMVAILAVRVVVLVAQNEVLSVRLADQANRDELTGLLNRRALMERLVAQERNETGGREYAVLYLDLDGFKTINDRFGHAAGDQALVAVAARLKTNTRARDHVARLGGDEFVVVTSERDPVELAGRLRSVVSRPVPWGDHELEFGCSIGVATSNSAAGAALLAAADAALYRSKQQGRSTVTVA